MTGIAAVAGVPLVEIRSEAAAGLHAERVALTEVDGNTRRLRRTQRHLDPEELLDVDELGRTDGDVRRTGCLAEISDVAQAHQDPIDDFAAAIDRVLRRLRLGMDHVPCRLQEPPLYRKIA